MLERSSLQRQGPLAGLSNAPSRSVRAQKPPGQVQLLPQSENHLLQRCYCHFTPDITSFCLRRSGKLHLVTACKTPPSPKSCLHPQHKVQGHFGRGSGTASRPNYAVQIFPFTDASYKALLYVSLLVFFFPLSLLLAEAASLWQELACKEVLQNSPACSL